MLTRQLGSQFINGFVDQAIEQIAQGNGAVLRFTAIIPGKRPKTQEVAIDSESDIYDLIRRSLMRFEKVQHVQLQPVQTSTVLIGAHPKGSRPRLVKLVEDCVGMKSSVPPDHVLWVTVEVSGRQREMDITLTQRELALPTNQLRRYLTQTVSACGKYISHVVLGTMPKADLATA